MKQNDRVQTPFSIRLYNLRKEFGLTQTELCDRVNSQYGGSLNKATISRYEHGEQEPMVGTVALLAKFFNVSPAYLIGDSEQRNSPAVSDPPALSEEASELLRIFSSLSVKKRVELMTFAFSLEDANIDIEIHKTK